jgi:predicted ester cyclase
MSPHLADLYADYIACLNAQDWGSLDRFVHPEVVHNGQPLGLTGYRSMLEANFRDIPDLRFRVALLVVETPRVASRLAFDCTPKGEFLDLPINGTRVSFAENVFYIFDDNRIRQVWSVIDKAAIEAQLRARPRRSILS